MMWNYDWNGWSWAGWCLMALTMALVVGATVWVIVTLTHQENPATPRSPEDVLADRLARGELSEEDYRRQRDLIRSHR